MKNFTRFILQTLALVCISFVFSNAQGVTTAQILGQITDSKGEPLVAATIQATHVPSGTIYGVYTREDGRYNIPNVRIGGPYTLKVTYVGYKESVQTIPQLALGQNFRANISLSEESVSLGEVVVSSEKNAIMNSENTGASTNIQREQLEAMPTLSRSLNDFLRMTPQSRSSSVASTTGGSTSFAGQDSRYNNLTIDGSIFNNSFGLAGGIGGQTNSTPISLDAIEEIQVNIAPYDVRQGGFTGAGINAVTKSGTNNFSGTAFYNIRNQSLVGKKADTTTIVRNDFFVNQVGLSIGGPIIKDKLFYFANFEIEKRDDPASSFVAFRDSVTTNPSSGNVSRVKAAELDGLRKFLIEKYNYDPGRYENYALETRSTKGIFKLDYNLNKKNRASLRFNVLKSHRDVLASNSGSFNNRTPSLFALNFEASNYIINNDVYSGIFELNTIIKSNLSNQIQIGYTANRDYRGSRGGIFPLIDILSANRNYTTFGYEPFTPNNVLNTNTFQFKDDIMLSLNRHNLTAGVNFEHFVFENTFTPTYYGQYVFNSLSDFYKAANGDSVGLARYALTYSALPGAALPTATTKVSMPGIYLQDELSLLKDRMKITAGLRVDVPIFGNTAYYNPRVDTMTFKDENGNNVQYKTDKLPDPQFMISPRLGINYDIFGNKKVQLRGGTGVFTGRPPFVWISNQVGNNGVLTGSISVNNTNTRLYPFSTDVTKNIPANPTLPTNFNLAITDNGFKFPQLWRSDVAVDFELPYGFIASLEAVYSKNLNAIYYINANLEPSKAKFEGPDNRPYYPGLGLSSTAQNNANRINDIVTDNIILKNTNQGYSRSFTAKVEKPFKNWYFMAAYNNAEAKDMITGGSIAFSSWRDNRSVLGNNNPDLAFSDFDQTHRIIGALSYAHHYNKFTSTKISLFLQSGNQGRVQFVYNGDYNGDQLVSNDLLFIPNDAKDLSFNTMSRIFGKDTVRVTADQQAAALNEFINSNDYLSSNKGKFLERNGYLLKWLTTVDLSFVQEFHFNCKEAKNKRTLQLRADIYNFTNMLNPRWGVGDFVVDLSPITATNSKTADNRPRVTFGRINDNKQYEYVKNLVRKSATLGDVWQAQLGVRYIF
ncbi:MAG TPA: carboxypeptidase regulatory-like domain-containing protein [Saprospiraceae bacterium]|nr:carboxypeptidase regulatory-like domain-containing protein [Saprospiraceae bacterium]